MHHRPLPLSLSLLFALACLAFPACDRQPAGGPEPDADADKVHTYRVRGKVVSVQGATANIHHEAIPGFVHIDGEAAGMDEMVMNLPLADEVDPATLAAGDRIAFDLHVRWEPEAEYWIDRIEPMPDDAELNITESADAHAEHDHHDHDHGHDHDHDHAHDHDH